MGGITQVKEHLVPKSRIQKMKHSVLGATNVKINGHPLLVNLLTECFVSVLGVQETEIIPTASSPLRHCVGLSCVPLSVFLEVTPILGPSETSSRIVTGLEVLHHRKLERKLGFVNWNWLVKSNGVIAAVFSWVNIPVVNSISKVDGKVYGNGFSPIPLSRERPVAQLVCDLRSALFE